MEVSVNSDSVRTLVVAESDVVKGILEGNVNQLRQAFHEQGLRMEQFNVHVNSGQGQGGMASSNWSFKGGMRGSIFRDSLEPRSRPSSW